MLCCIARSKVGQVAFDERMAQESVDYFHDAHLGSVQVSSQGSESEPSDVHYYSPWGLRLTARGGVQTGESSMVGTARPNERITRGFTGHEHDDALGRVSLPQRGPSGLRACAECKSGGGGDGCGRPATGWSLGDLTVVEHNEHGCSPVRAPETCSTISVT